MTSIYSMFEHGDGMAPHSDAVQASRTTASQHTTPAVQTALARLKTHYPEMLHERSDSQVSEPAQRSPGKRNLDAGYLADSGWEPAAAIASSSSARSQDEVGLGLLQGLSRTMNAVSSAAARAAVAAAAVPPVAASIHAVSSLAEGAWHAVGGAWDSISRTAAAGHQGLSLATISSVTAMASAGNKLQGLSTVGWVSGLAAPVQVSVHGYTCSCHWFIADDPATRVRHFVIQGTDCLESWKTNLNFEPVEFEHPSLKTRVHRGVYESAIVLYDLFHPLVTEHLRSHRSARVAFTGHSLGGSLATVLALMFKHRGVIMHANQLDGVITFGTAAVFCESASLVVSDSAASPRTNNGDTPAAASAASVPASALDSTLLLERLGLPRTCVSNVMTTRDIVPRAFACDYKLVASVLVSWGPTYAQHHGLLASDRKLLYSFAGQQMMLQPSSAFSWVTEETESRDLLMPPGPGLWLLAPPTTLSRLVAKMYTKQAAAASRAKSDRGAVERVPEAKDVSEALLHCMDRPHPFTILGDARAYGPTGSISRYHNPDNYSMAVREVAVSARARRVQLLTDLVRFLVSEQSDRSGVAWQRWLADWSHSAAILQQATATAAEATAIVWSQLRASAAATRRALFARDDVSQPLSALALSLQEARQRTGPTTAAAAHSVSVAMQALKMRADSHFRAPRESASPPAPSGEVAQFAEGPLLARRVFGAAPASGPPLQHARGDESRTRESSPSRRGAASNGAAPLWQHGGSLAETGKVSP